MPDISMCANTECPLRGACYRYLAWPNPYRQSYGLGFKPKLTGECDMRMSVTQYDRLRTKEEADEANGKINNASGAEPVVAEEPQQDLGLTDTPKPKRRRKKLGD